MANNIKVTFELEGNEALRTLTRLSKASEQFTDKTSKGFKKTNTAMSSFVGNLAAIGTSKAMMVISNQFREAWKNAIAFETAIAEINTLLPANEKLTKKTVQALADMSAEYGKDKTQQAKAFYQIVSAGVKGTNEQLEFLAISNQAATAGLTDTATAADVLTSSVNAYSSSGLTAQEASDALFISVREGKTTFNELAGSIGFVAPIAQSAGVAFNELTGAVAFLTKSGLKTENAVTGLKAILTAVIKPSEQAQAAAQKLGIDFSVSALKTKTFKGFLQELAEKTGGSTKALGKLIPNVRGLGPILNVVNGDMDDFNRILEESKKAAGATTTAYRIMAETNEKKMARATAVMQNYTQAFLAELIPAYASAFQAAGKFFNYLAKSKTESEAEKVKRLSKEIAHYNKQLAISKERFKAQSSAGNWFTKMLGDPKGAAKDIATFNGTIVMKQKELDDILLKQKEAAQKKEMNLAQQFWDAEAGAMAAESDKVIAEEAERQKLARIAAAEAKLLGKQEEINILNELENANVQAEFDRENMRTEFLENSNNEYLTFLQDNLGKETAIKELARIKDIKDEKKRTEALKKLNAKAVEQSKASLFDLSKFENMTNEQKIEGQRQTLAAMASLSSSSNRALFAIGKAAAYATAYMNTSAAVTNALKSIPYPFNFAAAAAVGAAGMIQVNKISATAKPSYAEGGIMGGSSAVNDRNLANVNSGEMILNKRQQNNLFKDINNGGSVGGGSTININSPTFLNEEMVDDVIDKINDRVELGNKRLVSSGVA